MTPTTYPPGAGLSGYTKERAEQELAALKAEKAGLAHRLTVAEEDGNEGAVKKCKRRSAEVDEQIKLFEKLAKDAKPEGSA